MSVRYEYNAVENILYVTGSENVTVDDYQNFKFDFAKIGFSDGLRVFADYRLARVDLSFSQMYGIASRVKDLSRDMRSIMIALIVSGSLGYGTGRMWSSMFQENNIHVEIFKNISDAEIWLKVNSSCLI